MEAGRSPNIEILSNADFLGLEGKPGAFTAKVRLRPRYINADKCTACGLCTRYCPRHLVDDYNEGLAITRPIHIDYPQAVPASYFIDPRACLHLQHGTCQICVPVCRSKAIDFGQQPEERALQVGAVIMSPGFGRISEETLAKFGFGKHPDVVTSIEFERLLNPSGPFKGEVRCISDKRHPHRIAFIQCVGSRDLGCDNGYCSSVCCMYAIKEAMVAKEHDPEVEITIYYMDMRTQGKDFDAARRRAEEQFGIKFVRARVADVMPWNDQLRLTYATLSGSHHFEPFDMVVLSVGLEAPKDAKGLASTAGFELNQYDFCKTSTFAPLATTRPGVLVAGAFHGPKDIPESVTQSSAAAGLAAGLLRTQRGQGTVTKSYPAEQNPGEEVRIGVFVCHCGINIGGVVDVPGVAKYAGGMEDVVYYTESLYSCSQDAQEAIKEKIRQHNLNRVVVAACSPRTHEPLFQETLKDAGLNRCLFEMVNIRDQCSWVHANEPEAATAKSRDLVRMAVAKARHIKPLPEQTVPVTPKALVLGGGVAGMTAALNLAEQGFESFLIEKSGQLGGNLLKLDRTLQGDKAADLLKELSAAVKKHKLITVLTNSELAEVNGFVGNFTSMVRTANGKKASEQSISHGVIIIATGGREHVPARVLGKEPVASKKIVTQQALEQQLAGGKAKAPASVVMVQCAGSRGDDLAYCSKVCCNHAVKNALRIKALDPASQVVVLYREMRTYGFAEDLYRQAREQGVIFIPYATDRMPEISAKGSKVRIDFYDPILQDQVTMEPELLALSVGIVPEGTKELSKLLKIPVNADDFYLEAHVKLRPVELPVSGVYVCGLAHSPKPIEETIVQAQAAAAKAAIPLVKGHVEVEPTVSHVDQEICIGCSLCTSLCPYQAIQMVQLENKQRRAQTIVASCKGCGICASHCPTFAISMGGFTDQQISSQIEAFGREENRND
ncbi:MAG: FAD-dependent oxidoreductase [Desulfobacteraceae bacterium]|nr:FAD-dependent oxidoreductase [Desulfobacteraceae bacterium]